MVTGELWEALKEADVPLWHRLMLRFLYSALMAAFFIWTVFAVVIGCIVFGIAEIFRSLSGRRRD